jgi:excisionase family DNA binding protein
MLAPVMEDSSVTFQLVSIAEAARVLNLSDSTVRRLVKAGRLEAQQVQRPQGHVWLVKVPASSQQPPEQPPRQIAASPADPSAPPALASWMASVLEPLVGELSVTRQQLVSQAETIGTLRADLANARATVATLEAQRAPQTVQPPITTASTLWELLSRWWPMVATLAVAIAVVLVLVLVLVPR